MAGMGRRERKGRVYVCRQGQGMNWACIKILITALTGGLWVILIVLFLVMGIF